MFSSSSLMELYLNYLQAIMKSPSAIPAFLTGEFGRMSEMGQQVSKASSYLQSRVYMPSKSSLPFQALLGVTYNVLTLRYLVLTIRRVMGWFSFSDMISYNFLTTRAGLLASVCVSLSRICLGLVWGYLREVASMMKSKNGSTRVSKGELGLTLKILQPSPFAVPMLEISDWFPPILKIFGIIRVGLYNIKNHSPGSPVNVPQLLPSRLQVPLCFLPSSQRPLIIQLFVTRVSPLRTLFHTRRQCGTCNYSGPIRRLVVLANLNFGALISSCSRAEQKVLSFWHGHFPNVFCPQVFLFYLVIENVVHLAVFCQVYLLIFEPGHPFLPKWILHFLA